MYKIWQFCYLMGIYVFPFLRGKYLCVTRGVLFVLFLLRQSWYLFFLLSFLFFLQTIFSFLYLVHRYLIILFCISSTQLYLNNSLSFANLFTKRFFLVEAWINYYSVFTGKMVLYKLIMSYRSTLLAFLPNCTESIVTSLE